MPKEFNFIEGETLLIDKPLEWSSFHVVNKIKYHLKNLLKVKKIKVGHAGTLDPLATGLLIICTGKKTKTLQELQGEEKEYTGTITLGKTTPSFDRETAPDKEFSIEGITNEQILQTAESFMGESDQVPPIFSAVKVDGKRAYKAARKGEEVKIDPRRITIKAFEITSINLPEIGFRIHCSKGTYIRSIARDFGERLQNGAHLSSLRRTKIGNYSVDDAFLLNDFLDLLPQRKQDESLS